MSNEDVLLQKVLMEAKNNSITEDKLFDVIYENSLDIMQFPEIAEKLISKGIRIIAERSDNTTKQLNNVVSAKKNNYTENQPQIPNFTADIYAEKKSISNPNKIDIGHLNFASILDMHPIYVENKENKVIVCNWTDVYIETMKLLARRNEAKLRSWSGMGDLYTNIKLPSNVDCSKYKMISRTLYIKVDYSATELMEKLRKYIYVCNEQPIDFVIVYNADLVIDTDEKKDLNMVTSVNSSNNSGLSSEINSASSYNTEKTLNAIKSSVDSNKSPNLPDHARTEKAQISFKFSLENIISGIKDRIGVLKKKTADCIDIVDSTRAIQSFSLLHEQIFELKNILNTFKDISKRIDEFTGTQMLFNQSNGLSIEELKEILLILIDKQKKNGHNILDNFDSNYNSDMLLTIANNVKLLQKWINELEGFKFDIEELSRNSPDIVSNNSNTASINKHDIYSISSTEIKDVEEYTVFSDFTKKKVKEIYFLGERYQVKGLAETTCIICAALWKKNKTKFNVIVDKYIEIEGKNLKIFSKEKGDYYFQNLEGTDLFIKIRNKTSKDLIAIIKYMLYYFELNPMKDLTFYVCENEMLTKRYLK